MLVNEKEEIEQIIIARKPSRCGSIVYSQNCRVSEDREPQIMP